MASFFLYHPKGSIDCSGLAGLVLVAAVTLTACGAAGTGESADDEATEASESGESDVVSLGGDGDDGALDGPSLSPSEIDGAGGAAGEGCFAFMSWGTVSLDGAVPGASGMDAIVSWMNESSTAYGAHFAEEPEITPEFLARYDVILLQDLTGWELLDDEIGHFKEWVSQGGGVMALSGYPTDPEQVTVTNRLLSFSGLNYVSVSEAGDTSTSLGNCGYCLGTTDKQEGWNEEHPIADGITAVGAFQGRSIQGGGQIVAQEEGKVLGMTTEVGEGRVFLFHDDWVSYRESWDQNAPGECTQNSECAGVSPRTTYQIPQFWFNSFSWLSGGRTCFAIDGVPAVR